MPFISAKLLIYRYFIAFYAAEASKMSVFIFFSPYASGELPEVSSSSN
jgi:hypothetical protein